MTTRPTSTALALALAVALAVAAGPRLARAQTDDPALSAPLESLLSEDPEVRTTALESIVALGEPAVPALETLAADAGTHPRQRAGAIYALGRIGAPGSRDVLSQLWGEGVAALGSPVAMQVAASLAELGELDALRELVRGDNPILAAKAAIQLGLRADADSLPEVQTAFMAGANASVQPYLAIALGLLGDNQAEATLRGGLRTEELRNHCAVALARLGAPEDARFELEFALQDLDPLVRLAALEAVIALEPRHLDDLLTTAAGDADPRVRQRAETAQADRARRPGRR